MATIRRHLLARTSTRTTEAKTGGRRPEAMADEHAIDVPGEVED